MLDFSENLGIPATLLAVPSADHSDGFRDPRHERCPLLSKLKTWNRISIVTLPIPNTWNFSDGRDSIGMYESIVEPCETPGHLFRYIERLSDSRPT